MKRQKSGIGDQRSERLEKLLRDALPPMEDETETHDLWPAMQRKLRAESARAPEKVRVPWFDWALGGGLALLLAAFPAWIPIVLYYL